MKPYFPDTQKVLKPPLRAFTVALIVLIALGFGVSD